MQIRVIYFTIQNKDKMEDRTKKHLWPIAGIVSVYLALGLTAFLFHQSKLTGTQEPAKQVQKQEEPTRIVSYIPTEVIENGQRVTINVPVYNDSLVPKDKCSKYVRIALKDIVGLEISTAEAWNQRYNAERIINFDKSNSLERLAEKGDIIGIENPQSPYRKYLDWTGNTVKYTHVGLYLGLNPEGRGLIAHKYHEETFVDTPKGLEDRGLRIVEVLKPSPKK